MFAQIINYFFRRDVNSVLSKNLRSRRFVNYSKAKTVMLLFESDYEEKNTDVRRIIQSLKADGKKVNAWGYVHKRVTETAHLADFRILNQKDMGWMKKPSAELLAELEKIEFDLLIDLTRTEIIPLQYIALFTKASCKAGVRINNLKIHDFMIDLDSLSHSYSDQDTEIDVSYIYNQIIFYLKSIETRD